MIILFSKKNLIFFVVAAFVLSVMAELYYAHLSGKQPEIGNFKKELAEKRQKAIAELKYLKSEITYRSAEMLQTYVQKDEAIDIYFFTDGVLKYWTSNFSNIDEPGFGKELEWNFVESSNSLNIACYINTNEGNLMAVIPIKSNYPFENNQIQNKFFPAFDLDKQINLVKGKATDTFAITDDSGKYLFSLDLNESVSSNSALLFVGFVIQLIFLILIAWFVVSYFSNKKSISLKLYVVIAVVTLLLLALSMYFSWPTLLYTGVLVSAVDYSAGYLMTSIVHLILMTVTFFVLCYVFYKYVSLEKVSKYGGFVFLMLTPALLYALVFFILKGLILHSRLPLNILSFDNIQAYAVLLHLIMLVWSVSLGLMWVKVHKHAIANIGLQKSIVIDVLILLVFTGIMFFANRPDMSRLILFQLVLLSGVYLRFLLRTKLSVLAFIAVWIFLFTLFFVETTSMFARKKSERKYKIIAENILINGSNAADRTSDLLLTDLYAELKNDAQIMSILSQTNNPDLLNLFSGYITDRYFRGYWNKFDIQIEILSDTDVQLQQYKDLSKFVGRQLATTSFYSFDASAHKIVYMGFFQYEAINGPNNVVLRFLPRKNFRSFSFPSFLFGSNSDIETNLNIAVAHFSDNELLYKSDKFTFPTQRAYYNTEPDTYRRLNKQKQNYFVYDNGNETIVVAELNNYRIVNYVLYFADLYIANLLVVYFFVWLIFGKQMKNKLGFGFRIRFQIAFVLLLVMSFFAILVVSVRFVSNKYKSEQLSAIDQKKSYIQHALQEKYYWIQDIETINFQGLNFDLQELSYMYQTDISVYNMQGRLAGSSQPLIFNKNLIGRNMAPKPFFGSVMPVNLEEKIGELSFLTGYAPLYNGDYLQIGYIAIPVFLSNQEYKSELNAFVNVIIHIYLIIAMLSVFLSFVIANQLSVPLKMIGTKLRQMSLGRKNERIDYQYNDEIGQLVIQYNNAIAELEKSADLLARSEREMAWRTMARQIAHEINNPLTPMKLTLQQLQRTQAMNDDRFEAYFKKSTQTLVEQIDNLSRIAASFSNFARLPEARLEKTDVAAKLNMVIQLFENNNEQTHISYSGQLNGVYIQADQEQLTQVFNNLLKNALQAIPSDRLGKIEVELRTERNQVNIRITDNGAGIPPEMLDKIFMPNFTTKSTGMGLGLAIVKSIVDTANGTIQVQSEVGKGSTFVLCFALL